MNSILQKLSLFTLFLLVGQFPLAAQGGSMQPDPEVKAVIVSSSIMSPLGRPRSPLKSSFYNKYMWDFDGRQYGLGSEYVRRDFSLLGLGKRVESSGKTVVYDAGVKNLTPVKAATEGMQFSPDAVSFSAAGNDYVIPLRWRSAPSGKKQLTAAEANLVTEYINKAIRRSGVTPSSVELSFSGTDFDVTVFKSGLSGESYIVKGYRLGSRAENTTYVAGIEARLKKGDYDTAELLANEALKKYPSDVHYAEVVKSLRPIMEIRAINKANPESRIFRVVESESGFTVYDGILPGKEYNTVEKDGFAKDLAASISDEVGTLYFDVSGRGSDKAANFVKTMEGQLATKKGKISVQSAPVNIAERNLLFGKNKFSTTEKVPEMISESQAAKLYKAETESATTSFKVVIGFKPTVAVKRVKKMAKSFFAYLEGTLFGRSKSLNQSVIKAKSDLMRNYPDLTPQQFETFVRDELGGTNYVLFLNITDGGQIAAVEE